MRVALVYDWVTKFGGAERILESLHEIWPEAPLYTAVYDASNASWARKFEIRPSFLQNFPFAKRKHELYTWLMPQAFETFDFGDFDIVISITSAQAKSIITKPKTLHVCYCLTPTRYFWNGYWDYEIPTASKFLWPTIRFEDQITANRPDIYVAISNEVSRRLKKYYKKESFVIYPPVDTSKWSIKTVKSENYFLIVSRLVQYKRIDIAIDAFNRLGWTLKIIGTGSEFNRLKQKSLSNIHFLGQLTDKEILGYYQKCKAIIFPGEEDFGLVPLEAQSCGKPVIAFGKGGALETIDKEKTGEFFYPQTSEALIQKLNLFDEKKYKIENCRNKARHFDSIKFKKIFKEFVEKQWRIHQKNITIS